jgi:hypothetical protein
MLVGNMPLCAECRLPLLRLRLGLALIHCREIAIRAPLKPARVGILACILAAAFGWTIEFSWVLGIMGTRNNLPCAYVRLWYLADVNADAEHVRLSG